MSFLTKGIWDRKGVSTLTRETYIRCIAFFTLVVGLFVALGAAFSYHLNSDSTLTMFSHTLPTVVIVILGSFLIAVIAIIAFQVSSNPLVSGIGVSVMSLALGVMIGPMVAMFAPTIVLYAILTTAGIMAFMSFMGIARPKFFEGIGPFILAGFTFLLFVLFGQIALIALNVPGANSGLLNTALNWLGVAVFTFMVAYDWSKALSLPYTLDNAIDASGGLILDAVNLFIRLLQLYAQAQGGSSRKNN